MAEEAKASMPQWPMEGAARPGLLDDNVGPKRSCSSPEDMGNRENICTVQEDDLDVLALTEKTPVQTKKAKRGGGYNLRKSLAWNQSFFTEEGVLNPLELSMLSGSVTKSSGSFLSRRNGEMSPLIEYEKSCCRTALNDVEVNASDTSRMKSETKDFKDSKLSSKSEALSQEEQQVHGSGKKHSAKRIAKIVPRPPTANSQKRVANTNATNPTSKLPKFMPTKSQASSLPMISRNVSTTTKSIKSNQTIARVNADHGVGARSRFSSNTRKESGCPPSLIKSSSHDLGNPLAPQAEKATSVFKVNPHPSGARMAPSSYPQNAQQVSSAPPLPAHAKPSALRMPSPSLGFFHQGKLPPSYGNHSHRNIQLPVSGIPLRKHINLKQTNELSPVPSTGRESTEGPVATESCSRTVVSGNLRTSPAANCLPCSTTIVDTHPSMKEKTAMGKMDMMNKRTSGSSYCQTSSQDKFDSNCFSVDDSIDKQSHISSLGKLNPHEDNLMLHTDTGFLAEESGPIEITENNHDAYPSTLESSESKLQSSNFSSQMCSPEKLKESESKQLLEGDLAVDDQGKHPHVGDMGDVSSSLLSKDTHSAGNSDFISNAGFDFTARNADHAALLKTESSLKLSKEQMAGASYFHSFEMDCSLDQKIGEHVQIIDQGSAHLASGLSSTLSEESQSTFCEDRKIRDCHAQSEVKKPMDSMEDRELMPDKSKLMDRCNLDLFPPRRQLNAVPFSDEWLAAVEAFGEDILELKTGPVQNSPPDKSPPEPSPWSPVKRKVQEIGPYDCTKYLKNTSTSESDFKY